MKEDVHCIKCENEVESECNVLTHCPLYDDIRNTFYQSINDFQTFSTLSDDDKLCFMLGNPDNVKPVARTCYEMLDRRKVLTYL